MFVLALDDEKYALESLSEQLKLIFCEAEIKEETKPSEALSWAENLAERGEELSYAFLDIQMRGMNGLEVAARLKDLHPRVVVFFCTAYSEYAFDAFGLYAKGYLLKPVQAKDIEQVLDEVLFLRDGYLVLKKSVEDIRAEEGKSVDELFREVFRW